MPYLDRESKNKQKSLRYFVCYPHCFYSSFSNIYCCAWRLLRADSQTVPQRSTSETKVARTGGLEKIWRKLAPGDWSREHWDLWQLSQLGTGCRPGSSLSFLTAAHADVLSAANNNLVFFKGLSYTLSVNE